jgi:CDP-diacylglycerol--serine O-phosphatidyltransferase
MMLKFKFKERNLSHIVPNAITFANMALGVIAIYLSMGDTVDKIKAAAAIILIAGAADKLDGFAAKKLGSVSEFGKELDSLCDLVSFGVAPILVWWNMGMDSLNFAVCTVSLLYIGAGAYRLARFNLGKDKGYIVGLPITIAGMAMAGKVLIDISFRLEYITKTILMLENLGLTLLLSLLMASSFKIKRPL